TFWVFVALCQLARSNRLILCSCLSGHDFTIASSLPTPPGVKLASRYMDSSVTTHQWDFHPRCMTCPSYIQKLPDKARKTLQVVKNIYFKNFLKLKVNSKSISSAFNLYLSSNSGPHTLLPRPLC